MEGTRRIPQVTASGFDRHYVQREQPPNCPYSAHTILSTWPLGVQVWCDTWRAGTKGGVDVCWFT